MKSVCRVVAVKFRILPRSTRGGGAHGDERHLEEHLEALGIGLGALGGPQQGLTFAQLFRKVHDVPSSTARTQTVLSNNTEAVEEA